MNREEKKEGVRRMEGTEKYRADIEACGEYLIRYTTLKLAKEAALADGVLISGLVWEVAHNEYGCRVEEPEKDKEPEGLVVWLGLRHGLFMEDGINVSESTIAEDSGDQGKLFNLSNGVIVEQWMGETMVFTSRRAYAIAMKAREEYRDGKKEDAEVEESGKVT